MRAHADGWAIEYKNSSGEWLKASGPSFSLGVGFRVIPDEDGWIPWYAHEDAKCPVDDNTLIEVILGNPVYGKRPAFQYNWTEDSIITKYRIVKEKDKTFKEDKPECFNNPDATWGGSCYWQDCMHHLRDEPICGSLKGTNNTSTVEERLGQIEESQDILLNKMVTNDDVEYLKRRISKLEDRLNGITDTEDLMTTTTDFSVEDTIPHAIKHVTSNDKGIYASGQGWDIINTKYLDKLLKLEKENEDE